ncbi:MAG: Ig-like domain-containing protein [Planctomycetota bacterium]
MMRYGVVSPWVAVLVLAACDGEPDSLTAPEVPVASVTVSPATAALPFGTTIQLTATVRDTAGHVLTDRTAAWSSSDSAIATVTSRGLASGVAPGSAMITATVAGASGAASVTVNPLVFAAVSAGGIHTCGLTTDGAVYCWGWSVDDPQYGGATTDGSGPRAVSGGLTFQSVSAGGLHACGVTTDGSVYCWGSNAYGQLGNGTVTDESAPRELSGDLAFASVSAGGWHTCGLTTDDAAHCWGANDHGQLGNGGTTPASTPVSVSGAEIFQSLSAGRTHTCGVAIDSAAYCWGTAPAAVPGGLSLQSLSAGQGHTCGVSTDGEAHCWGAGQWGQLGNGSPITHSATPVPVSVESDVASVTAGGDHSCGVVADGVAYCWGLNTGGQLGNGSADRVAHATPELVLGGLAFQSVSTGLFHTCGLTTDGTAYCWGWNNFGQLGTNDATDNVTVPVLVTGQQ